MSIESVDLEGLIFQNADARQYYNELPKKVREKLKPHSEKITSYESLRDYVEMIKRERR